MRFHLQMCLCVKDIDNRVFNTEFSKVLVVLDCRPVVNDCQDNIVNTAVTLNVVFSGNKCIHINWSNPKSKHK